MTGKKRNSWDIAKAHFVVEGGSLSKWCREHDTDIGSLRKAFDGDWRGPRARFLVGLLKKEVGLTSREEAA